jgi:hypothetical protein
MSPAPTATYLSLDAWHAFAATGARATGLLDIGLAAEVLTAGLDATMAFPAVLEALCPERSARATPESTVSDLAGLFAPMRALCGDAHVGYVATLETAVAPWFAVMSNAGLPVDRARWRSCVTRAGQAVAVAVERFAALTGAPRRLDDRPAVNLESGPEVCDGFRRIGGPVPVDLKQATLRDAAANTTSAVFHQAVESLLAYRGAKAVLDWASAPGDDDRLRGRWRQLGTSTGRATCEALNLCGVPRPLRAAVCAPEGSRLVVADFSGQELGVVAVLAGDRQLVDDLNSSDPYASLAQQLGIGRPDAKAALLGYLYGASDARLAAVMGQPAGAAAQLRDVLDRRYPQVAQFLGSRAPQAGRLSGPVAVLAGSGGGDVVEITGGGRRRWASAPTSGPEASSRARQARNFPVQARASTMSKLALGRVSRMLADQVPAASVVHFVVDEFVVEVPAADADRAAEVVSEAMVWASDQCLDTSVRAVVDARVVAAWGDAKGASHLEMT